MKSYLSIHIKNEVLYSSIISHRGYWCIRQQGCVTQVEGRGSRGMLLTTNTQLFTVILQTGRHIITVISSCLSLIRLYRLHPSSRMTPLVSTPFPRAAPSPRDQASLVVAVGRAVTMIAFPFLLMMLSSSARAAPSPRVHPSPAVVAVIIPEITTVHLVTAKGTLAAAAAAAVNRSRQVEANRKGRLVSTPFPRAAPSPRDQASLVVAVAAVVKDAVMMTMTVTVMMITPALAASPRAQANRKGPRVSCSTPQVRARDQASLSLVVAVVESAAVVKDAATMMTVGVLMMILVVAAAGAAGLEANRKGLARARDLMPLSLKLPRYPRVRYCTF